MSTQFITNEKGKKTAVIIPINEYEDLLHQHHLNRELTDEYKAMIDSMINEEENNQAKYTSFRNVKNRFSSK
jgi:hypothetical protein